MIKTLLKCAITVCGIGLIIIFFRDTFDEALGIIKECNLLLFGCALLVWNGNYFIAAQRFRNVLNMQGLRMSQVHVIKLTLMGLFFNMFFPSTVGGDIAKAYYVQRYSGERGKSYIAVIIDRFIGLFSLFTLCAISFLFSDLYVANTAIVVAVITVLFAGIFSIFFFSNKHVAHLCVAHFSSLFPHKVNELFKTCYLLIHECRNHKWLMVKSFFISVIFQGISILAAFILAQSLHVHISLITFCVLLPLVFASGILPSINGLGVREGAFIYFFSFVTTRENAVALSLMSDVLLYSGSLVGALVYLFHHEGSFMEIKKSEKNQNHDSEIEEAIKK